MKSPISKRFDEEVAFLKALIQTPSINPPGKCAKAAETTASELERLGLQVEHVPVPKPFVHQYGMKSVTNLLVRRVFGSGTGPTVALQAHGDTVPPGDGWSHDPYGAEERGGYVYGLGADDAKSDIAAFVFALLALDPADASLNGTIEVHITYDEVTGGALGPAWLMGQGLTKPDYAITSGFTHSVTTAHNGCLHLEIVLRGRQAHAAEPSAGVDAMAATVPILAALYAERDRLGGIVSAETGIGSPTLTVGRISGGISVSVVPDRVMLQIDRRLIPEEDGDAVEDSLTKLITKAVPGDSGVEVECRRLMLAEPLRPAKKAKPLAKLLRKNAEAVLGTEVPITGAPLFTDARHYASAGIPTVLYGAGPRSMSDSSAHSADEHISLKDLKGATKVVARTLRDILSGKLA